MLDTPVCDSVNHLPAWICRVLMIDTASDQPMDRTPSTCYCLRITLRQISPLIWRRVLVRPESTIADLHYTLQIAFGWSDAHLHRFRIHGKDFGVAHDGGMTFGDDPARVCLAAFQFRPYERFRYDYDFHDLWQHDIHLEQELAADATQTYPVCVAGARAAPPEDCGGPTQFMALRQHYSPFTITERVLELLADDDPDAWRDAAEERQWLAYWLTVECFDRRRVNRRLCQYAAGDEAWQWDD